jgi:hypothetical protein
MQISYGFDIIKFDKTSHTMAVMVQRSCMHFYFLDHFSRKEKAVRSIRYQKVEKYSLINRMS